MRDLGNFENRLIALLKLAELEFVANCRRVNKIWSASIVAGGIVTAKLRLTCGVRLLLFA